MKERFPSDMISSKISFSRGAERLQLAVAVVDDADGGGESQLEGAVGDWSARLRDC